MFDSKVNATILLTVTTTSIGEPIMKNNQMTISIIDSISELPISPYKYVSDYLNQIQENRKMLQTSTQESRRKDEYFANYIRQIDGIDELSLRDAEAWAKRSSVINRK